MSKLTLIGVDIIEKNFSKAVDAYELYTSMHQEIASRISKKFADIPEGPLLEIGPGTGYLTQKIIACYPTRILQCIDISPEMVKKLSKNLPNVMFEVADIEEKKIHEKYAAIFSSMTLQWLKNPQQTIDSLLETLLPGGIAYFAFPGAKSYLEWRQFCIDCHAPCSLNPLIEIENLFSSKFRYDIEELVFEESFDSPLHFFQQIKGMGAQTRLHSDKIAPYLLNKLIKEWHMRFNGPFKISTTIYLCVSTNV